MARVNNNNRSNGAAYEKMAAKYLRQKEFQILNQNFCSRYGEIDLVARDGKYLVFVEVKYRENSKGGHPLEAVDFRKRRRICKTADYYCMCFGYRQDTPCRFDVVGILGDEIIHISNAFEYVR